MPESTFGELRQRARWLVLWSLAPLLLWVGLLAVLEGRNVWRVQLDDAAQHLRLQHRAFEVLVRDTARHVDDLARSVSEDTDPETAPGALRRAVQARRAGGGHTLDALDPALRPDTAQLLWSGETPPDARSLARLRQLSRSARIAHANQPELVWSYVFDWPDKALQIFPWQPSEALLQDGAQPSLPRELNAWYGYEVVRKGTEEGEARYWTEPYLDAGGRGLMVSHARRVEVEGRLRGIAGADIKLDSLVEPLSALPSAPWQAWVIDERGTVLADRGQALPGNRVLKVGDRLPWSLDTVREAGRAPERARAVDGWRLFAIPVEGSPWLLVLAAPDRALQEAVARSLLPYGLIVLALAGFWVWGQALISRRILQPLLGLFDHLQRQIQAPGSAPADRPRLDGSWQPWLARIDQLFAGWREAQRQQRQAEALKAAVIDHAQVAVVVFDGDDRILECNPAACALLGWSRDEVLGQPLISELWPERFREVNREALTRLRADDPDHLAGHPLRRRVRHAQGEEIPVEVVMWKVEVEGRALITVSMRDLREARAAAAVIEQQREALRQSEKLSAMGSLLASVAHELNNPLTIVVGRSTLLEDSCAGTPQADDARRIREAAERCAHIVRTFLHMARSRPAKRQPVPLNDLARAAGEMLAYTLRSHGIELHWSLAADLPEVMADPDQLGQVLLNLLVNAQQALAVSEARPRRILISSQVLSDAVALRIQDNGPGVPEALREQIFDPFFTTKTEGKGTGLGLSVSRSILREHGGDLQLQADGPGACFELRLPR